MKTFLFSLASGLLWITSAFAQDARSWTEQDRQYLLSNLTRPRDLVMKATQNLTTQQWNFRESPDRWSIRQVVEHMALWELLFDREISQALSAGPQPALAAAARPDSVILGFILEEKPHVTTEYTQPFTFSVPMGLNEGTHNLSWLLQMRNESITYLQQTPEDLRLYFLRAGRPSVHQVYINAFGHLDRHLRQIQKIKTHPAYPKSSVAGR